MLYAAWINFGLYLPHDGSLDGDADTLQRNKRAEVSFTNDNEMTLDEMKRRVTIPKRSSSRSGNPLKRRRKCPYRPKHYDITALDSQSRLHERPLTLYERNTMNDCARLNASQQRIYDELMSKDLSNAVDSQPDTRNMITIDDVHVLHQVVSELRGEDEADYMQTHVLGLPIRRKEDGTVCKAASWQPEIDWSTVVPPQRFVSSDDFLRDAIVKHLRIPGLIESDDHVVDESDAKATDPATLHRQELVDELLFMNAARDQRSITVHAPFIQRYSTLKPESGDSFDLRISIEAARRGGGRRGRTRKTGYELCRAFSKYVVSNGALFRMKWQHEERGAPAGTEEDDDGMYLIPAITVFGRY